MKNNIKINTCTICGSKFETTDIRVKTCSPECSGEQKKLNHQKFLDKKAGKQISTIKLKCVVCKKQFESTDIRVKTCCKECRIEYKNNVKKYSLKNYHESLTGIEGVDYVTCKWCGEKVKRIFGKHINTYHSGKTSKDYKLEFPGCPLTTLSDIANFSKSSGLHMKEENYRKRASEKMKGENNPNHSSKTTDLERAERSPFSKAFYEKRNLNEEDRLKFINAALEGREFETRIEYWLCRGYTEEESIEKIHNRQITFSLEKCIERHGEEKGLEVWKERQEKWKAKVFNKDTYIGGGTSILSENIILEILKHNKSTNTLNFGKDEKFISDINNDRVYKYDITNKNNKRIIEINGVFWHCKPSLYESEYYHKVKQLSAQEIWDYDKRKIEVAESYGYKVMTIWECQLGDVEKTRQRVVAFLENDK